MALDSCAVPPGEDFLDRVATLIFEQHADATPVGDLSSLLILVPALPIAAELRSSMLRLAPRAVLLPRFDTLAHWVQSLPLPGISERTPDSERLVLLHEALRERGWFDEVALWGIAAELSTLFDELTAASVSLPADEATLTAQLQAAYALRDSAPLAFEARVVHVLWGALAAAGHVDRAADHARRLAVLADQGEKDNGLLPERLLLLLDAAPEESLAPTERTFFRRYGERYCLSVYHPAPRGAASSPLMAALAAAWTESSQSPESSSGSAAPLFERAVELAACYPQSPLVGRLQLVPTAGREQEAQAVVAQLAAWLATGLRRIVLIAQDRLTARRVRALLEREGVLVSDETGWKLSTSRAAAAIDALLETAAAGAYYRDVIDLCKSPYVFADLADGERKAAVFALDAAIRKASVKAGLPRIRRCLQDVGGDATSLALSLVERIEVATTLLRARPAPLAKWLARLQAALGHLGALEALQPDVAGKALLDLFDERQRELAESRALFSFSAWRDWLNRELEAANFRDAGIVSPIVVTPLNAVCLRRFEAAVLIGGDARQLAPATNSQFFNQSVRRELGLRTQADGERELRRDLELLLATVPRVVVTWQAEQDGEANLLAPELALLSSLHQLAYQDDLQRPPLSARRDVAADSATAPRASVMAMPAAPLALVPQRVSVSGYASLVACPYRFFARHVLRLGEMDEVSEEMDKSDFGALVHRVLERFHERHPLVSALDEAGALTALQACVAEVFAPAVEENFLATGWRLRWENRLTAYLEWQRAKEAEGWRWAQAEARVARDLPLADGSSIEFYGRIDRIDLQPDGAASLLDYKTQTAKIIRDRLPEDVQLPSYALLHGNATQAAYVALDDERIVAVQAVDSDDDGAVMASARAHGERLQAAFSALRHGANLPAHGADSVCRWCEMDGLCRRDYVADER